VRRSLRRARRFNRSDPFFGNVQDPLSLHKYLYVHGDPVSLSDPAGRFATVIGLGLGVAWALSARRKYDANVLSVGAAVGSAVRVLAGYYAAHIIMLALQASWSTLRPPTPTTAFEGRISSANRANYVYEVKAQLMTQVTERFKLNSDAAEYAAGANGATAIANAYVDAVIEKAAEDSWLVNHLPPWMANSVGGTKCKDWASLVSGRLVGPANLSGWTVRTHYNSNPYWFEYFVFPWPGDAGEGANWLQPSYAHHSFVSLTYHKKTSASGKSSRPDWVLDPWATRLPDVYDAAQFHRYWPLNQRDPLTGQDNSDIDMDWPSNP